MADRPTESKANELFRRAHEVFLDAQQAFDEAANPSASMEQRKAALAKHDDLRRQHEELSVMWHRERLGATLQ